MIDVVQQHFRPCTHVRIIGPEYVDKVQIGRVYPVHKWVGNIPVINISEASESPTVVECRVPGGEGLVYHPLWEPAPAPAKVEKQVKSLTTDEKFERFFGTAFALWLILVVGLVGSVLASRTWGITTSFHDSKRVESGEDVQLDEKIDRYLDGDKLFADIADEFPSLDRRMHPLLYTRASFVCDHRISKNDDPEQAQRYRDQVIDSWVAHYSNSALPFKIIMQIWKTLAVLLCVLVLTLFITAIAVAETT